MVTCLERSGLNEGKVFMVARRPVREELDGDEAGGTKCAIKAAFGLNRSRQGKPRRSAAIIRSTAAMGCRNGASRAEAAVNRGVMKNRMGMRGPPRKGRPLPPATLDDMQSSFPDFGYEFLGQGVQQRQPQGQAGQNSPMGVSRGTRVLPRKVT